DVGLLPTERLVAERLLEHAELTGGAGRGGHVFRVVAGCDSAEPRSPGRVVDRAGGIEGGLGYPPARPGQGARSGHTVRGTPPPAPRHPSRGRPPDPAPPPRPPPWAGPIRSPAA